MKLFYHPNMLNLAYRLFGLVLKIHLNVLRLLVLRRNLKNVFVYSGSLSAIDDIFSV